LLVGLHVFFLINDPTNKRNLSSKQIHFGVNIVGDSKLEGDKRLETRLCWNNFNFSLQNILLLLLSSTAYTCALGAIQHIFSIFPNYVNLIPIVKVLNGLLAWKSKFSFYWAILQNSPNEGLLFLNCQNICQIYEVRSIWFLSSISNANSVKLHNKRTTLGSHASNPLGEKIISQKKPTAPIWEKPSLRNERRREYIDQNFFYADDLSLSLQTLC
jgi:hypothetical protein